jgi:membrane associated rhomboid family serine protease
MLQSDWSSLLKSVLIWRRPVSYSRQNPEQREELIFALRTKFTRNKMSAAQTAVSIAKSVPLGTTIIVALSSTLFMIDSFTGYKINDSLCLSSNRLTTGIFSHFFSLILNPLVHAGPLHYTVGVLMFPIVATGVEKQLGTIGFLNLFVTGTLITSMAYILVTWTVSWFVASVS